MATTYPLSDEFCYYDLIRRQYVLTSTGLLNYTGLKISDFVDEPELENIFLEEFSDDVYDYIYEHTRIDMIKFKRWFIAKNSDIRNEFIKALAVHARDSLRSNLFLLKSQHGVNIEKGKAIPLKDIRGARTISYSAERILSRLGLLNTGYMYTFSDYDEDGTF